MTLNEFIFSNKNSHKLRRHIAFWGIIGVGYYFQSLIPVNRPFFSALISVLCYLPMCIFTTYAFLYFLWPTFLQRRNYAGFAFGFTLLVALTLIVNYFTSIPYYGLTCDCPISTIASSQFFGLGLTNAINDITLGVLALGIAFGKGLLLKQRENQVLLKQKLSKELQFQKGRIYPAFLFNALNRLDSKITSGSSKAPEFLLRLSDLLSYLLYESNEELIPLATELDMIRDLLAIEQINQEDHLSIHSNIVVSPNDATIKPLILFPLLHNCLEAIDNTAQEQFRVNLNIRAGNPMLHFNLVIEQLGTESNRIDWHNILEGVRNKLILLTDGSYHLDIMKQKLAVTINLELLLFSKVKPAI